LILILSQSCANVLRFATNNTMMVRDMGYDFQNNLRETNLHVCIGLHEPALS